LELCLQSQYRAESKPGPRKLLTVLAVLFLAALVWAGFAMRERMRWRASLDALRAEPGLVVVDAGTSFGSYYVTGLRDPLARDPAAVLQSAGVAPAEVRGRWELYQALDPPFVLARARGALQPPSGVDLSFRDGVLAVTGDAPAEWITQARRIAPLLAGVARIDFSASLENQIRGAIQRIDETVLLFVLGSTEMIAGQQDALDQLVANVRDLDRLAEAAGRRFRLEILGHTDGDGTDETNDTLSLERANTVLARLSDPPLTNIGLQLEGVGSRRPAVEGGTETEKQSNRRVTLRVRLL
jgi:OOP family OmpA-OmpF porin